MSDASIWFVAVVPMIKKVYKNPLPKQFVLFPKYGDCVLFFLLTVQVAIQRSVSCVE